MAGSSVPVFAICARIRAISIRSFRGELRWSRRVAGVTRARLRQQPSRGPRDGVQARRVRPGMLARDHRRPTRAPVRAGGRFESGLPVERQTEAATPLAPLTHHGWCWSAVARPALGRVIAARAQGPFAPRAHRRRRAPRGRGGMRVGSDAGGGLRRRRVSRRCDRAGHRSYLHRQRAPVSARAALAGRRQVVRILPSPDRASAGAARCWAVSCGGPARGRGGHRRPERSRPGSRSIAGACSRTSSWSVPRRLGSLIRISSGQLPPRGSP